MPKQQQQSRRDKGRANNWLSRGISHYAAMLSGEE